MSHNSVTFLQPLSIGISLKLLIFIYFNNKICKKNLIQRMRQLMTCGDISKFGSSFLVHTHNIFTIT